MLISVYYVVVVIASVFVLFSALSIALYYVYTVYCKL